MSRTAKDSADTDLVEEFYDLVNMSATQLEHWLESDESKSVGQVKDGKSEATGHQSGRAIVKLLREKRKSEHSAPEIEQMQRTVLYIKRHTAQRPHKQDLEHTRWTASLKNWGHDPLK